MKSLKEETNFITLCKIIAVKQCYNIDVRKDDFYEY